MFRFISDCRKHMLLYFFYLAFCPTVMAQTGPLACHDRVQVSLDTGSCEALIDSSLLLSGNIPAGLYQVELFYDQAMTQAVPSSPVVSSADMGRLLYASVRNATGSNSCWGTILVEDKWIPSLECLSADTIDCREDVAPALGGEPGFPLPAGIIPMADSTDAQSFTVPGFDPCGDLALRYVDADVGGTSCGVFFRIVQRDWLLQDAAGNTDTCRQLIYLENFTDPFDPATDCPPDWFAEADTAANNNGRLLCDQRRDDALAGDGSTTLGWNSLPDGHRFAGHPSPFDALYPNSSNVKWFGTGQPSIPECGSAQSTFTDQRINICATGNSTACFKIVRDWFVVDWCTGAVEECQQVIKIEDDTAPQFSLLEDLTLSVDVWRCELDWTVPEPQLTDNCNALPLDYSVSVAGQSVSRLSNGRYLVEGLAPGTYDIIFSSSDCCGNRANDSLQLTVIDAIPPVAVCDQNTVVGLTANADPDDPNNGTSKVFAATFDDGSYDNCSPQVWFKVIRMDEFDANQNGQGGELDLKEGDWAARSCGGANGDDDPSIDGAQAYFDDFLKVCCEDTDQDIQVVFRVFDVDPTPYEFRNVFPPNQFPQFYLGRDASELTGILPAAMSDTGALFGHFTDCMVSLDVDDKIAPFLQAPEDIWLSCDFDLDFDPDRPNDFLDAFDGLFGKIVANPNGQSDLADIILNDRVCVGHPKFNQLAPANPALDPCYENIYAINWGTDGFAIDNCSVDIQQSISSSLVCGKGTITRSWTGQDEEGN
ncbi:MAG: hypothetical protein AAFV25_15950, partial [Bacteroidota bacterium]